MLKFRSKLFMSKVKEYAKHVLKENPEEREYLEDESFLMLNQCSLEWEAVVAEFEKSPDCSTVSKKLMKELDENNLSFLASRLVDLEITRTLEQESK